MVRSWLMLINMYNKGFPQSILVILNPWCVRGPNAQSLSASRFQCAHVVCAPNAYSLWDNGYPPSLGSQTEFHANLIPNVVSQVVIYNGKACSHDYFHFWKCKLNRPLFLDPEVMTPWCSCPDKNVMPRRKSGREMQHTQRMEVARNGN